MFGCNAADKE
jgi:hypothetical protein